MTKRYKTLRTITNHYTLLQIITKLKALQTTTTQYKILRNFTNGRRELKVPSLKVQPLGHRNVGKRIRTARKETRAPPEAPDGRLALAVADRGLGYPASESAGGESGREARIWFQGTVAEARFAVSARTLLLDPPGRTFYNPRPRS